MSCNCLKIYLQRVPDNIPADMKEANGTVMLDLFEDQTFLKSKKNEQLTAFDKISGAAVLGIKVPPTDKNNLILCGYAVAGAYDFNHKAKIAVVVFENGVVLDQDVLIVIEESRKGWELDFSRSDAFWKEALIDTRLNEIIWDCFTVNEANINAQWVGSLSYADGDVGYLWTLAHFKNWHQLGAVYDSDGILITKGEAGIEDTRPFLYVLPLLQKGFCLKGWKFRSPILESTFGRQLLTYVLEDFSEGGDLSGYGFRASVQNTYSNVATGATADTALELHSRDEGTGLNYDACDFHRFDSIGITVPLYAFTIYHYATDFSGNATVNYCVDISTPTATGLTFIAVVRDSVIGCVVPACPLDLNQENIGITTVPVTFCGTLQLTGIKPTDVITFEVQVSNPAALINIHAGSYWEMNHNSLVIQDGAVVPINQIVKNYKFLDFFKGVLHIFGRGKIFTDFVNKEIWLFHETEVQLFDLTIPEPFYDDINDPIVITDRVQCKSRVTKLNTKNLARYYRLCFKDSTDTYVDSLNFNNDDNPLWGRLIDNGPDFPNNDTTKSCNPFFEPTHQILADDLETLVAPFELPALWDDEEDRTKIAYDIGPRILYLSTTLGFQLATDDGAGGYTYRDLHYQAGIISTIPNLFQWTDQAIGIGAAATAPIENVVYGTTLAQNNMNDAKDMYVLFWRQLLLETYKAFSVFYDVLIDNCLYNDIDFRKYIQFLYEGQFLTFKLLQIRGFKPCLAIPSKFELRPIVIPDTCLESDCIQCYTIDEEDVQWIDEDSLSSVKVLTGAITSYPTTPGQVSTICVFGGFGIKQWLQSLFPDADITCALSYSGSGDMSDIFIKICDPPEALVSITICFADALCASTPGSERTFFFTPSTECS